MNQGEQLTLALGKATDNVAGGSMFEESMGRKGWRHRQALGASLLQEEEGHWRKEGHPRRNSTHHGFAEQKREPEKHEEGRYTREYKELGDEWEGWHLGADCTQAGAEPAAHCFGTHAW